jgi:hypothetical protein
MADARNPYAFPALTEDDEYNGMTLRDWFAGQALAGLLSNSNDCFNPEGAARVAFEIADAMLAERERGQ